MLLTEFLLTNKRMRKKNGINPHIQQMARAYCILLVQMSNILAFVYFTTLVSLSFPSAAALVLFYLVFWTHLCVLTFPGFSLVVTAPSFLRIFFYLINSVSNSV